MRVSTCLSVAVLSVLLVGCGQEVVDESADEPAASAPQPPAPTALSCPSDTSVHTAGGLLSKMPNGFDTREEAVEDWLSRSKSPTGGDWGGADYIIDENGREAWILRDDGTAVARVRFLRHSGFTVHGYNACTS